MTNASATSKSATSASRASSSRTVGVFTTNPEAGTDEYKSPEVRMAGAVGTRRSRKSVLGAPVIGTPTDVFSFGVITEFDVQPDLSKHGANGSDDPDEGSLADLLDACIEHEQAARPTAAKLVQVLGATLFPNLAFLFE